MGYPSISNSKQHGDRSITTIQQNHNDKQLHAVQIRMDSLMDIERDLTTDETDYLEMLSTLIYAYE